MYFPPWTDEEIDKEMRQILIICPKCDHESVIDSEGLASLCGKCFAQGKEVDMIPLGAD
jgi:hypothetical protein